MTLRKNSQDPLKEDASSLPYPEHGGDRMTAAQIAGMDSSDILDFSVSVNPLGPPACVQNILSESASKLAEYPSLDSRDFKNNLSSKLGVDPNRITVTNGSTELIYLLPHLFKSGKEVLIVDPCFSEYERAFQLAGIPVHSYALEPAAGFNLEIDKFLFQLQGMKNVGGVVIGHPNSPTGSLCKPETLSALLKFCEKRKIFLIVDETFIEFAGPGRSLVKSAENFQFLVLVHSMTKFYALPGLRIGYGVMSPQWIRKIEAHRPPWSVNTIAQTVGAAVLTDAGYVEGTREFVRREKIFLHENLSAMESLEVFSSDANFILFRLLGRDEDRADRLYLNLLHAGILIRNCGNFNGLDRDFFRIAVRTRKDNEELILKLKNHLRT